MPPRDLYELIRPKNFQLAEEILPVGAFVFAISLDIDRSDGSVIFLSWKL